MAVVGARGGLNEDQIADCLHAMDTDAVKDELKRVTKEAEEEGAFGLPYIITRHRKGDEAYFGCDRFEIMAARLGIDWHGPFPPTEEGKKVKELPVAQPPDADHIAIVEELKDIEAIKFTAGIDLKPIFEGVPLKNDPNDDNVIPDGKK